MPTEVPDAHVQMLAKKNSDSGIELIDNDAGRIIRSFGEASINTKVIKECLQLCSSFSPRGYSSCGRVYHGVLLLLFT